MTIQTFDHIVAILARQGPVRSYLNLGPPENAAGVMGIDVYLKPQEIAGVLIVEMKQRGFHFKGESDAPKFIYRILRFEVKRTGEDGSEYVSSL